MSGVRTVVAQRITPAAWAPFGWVPVEDTDPVDGKERLGFDRGDPHVNVISHAPGEIRRKGTGLVCDRLYRHKSHTQVLLALNGPSVIAVAPSGTDLSIAVGAEEVRAFRLEALDAVVLHRGTWHWGPFPLGDEPVRLFNVQGLGYRDDNNFADLADAGVELVVEV